PSANPTDVAAAVDLIAAARRPVFFVGHGTTLSEAGPEMTELQARWGIPVITSPNGMGLVPADDPLTLGFIGRNGAYPANQAGRFADLVICIGTRFDDRSSSSWHPGYSWNFPTTKLLQVDIDPSEIGRNYPPTLGIIADAKTFAGQLIAALAERDDVGRETFAEWRAEVAGWRAEWEAFVRPNFALDTSPIRPEFVVGALAGVLPDDVILSLDSGVHHNWFMQFWQPKRAQSMLNSWGYSSMGFGVCGVLGAQLAAPDRPCVAVVGDGGFMMAPHVVATAVEYDLPCIWIVWNNFAWGAIRDLQYGLFEGREIGTAFYRGNQGPGGERYNPDFAAWARACGADGVTVTRSQDLAGAVETALRNRRPCLIDLHVDADVRPPSTGTWSLPPIPHKEPIFGRPHRAG
ncbi:MAG: thiamine pyrophosphate-binding protein, partial [Phyllobacteriaceae bacterium]|nr:thiamine pyrophosphate-binding protein [Phyllobacteriaceae bacterium]